MNPNAPLTILAWPGFHKRNENPYGYLLYKQMEEEGHKVKDFDLKMKDTLWCLLSGRFDIFHMHWPRNLLKRKTDFRVLKNLLLFLTLMVGLRLRAKPVVWTVHNLEPHESRYPVIERWLLHFLCRRVDGFISMNRAGLEPLQQSARNNSRQQFAYIPHPYYKDYYPDDLSRQEARRRLGLKDEDFVFLFLGQIRSYKNLPGLIKAFKQLNGHSRLLIAGKAHPEIAGQLPGWINGEGRILLEEGFVDDSHLQQYLKAADIAVLPYQRIFNSGSVFLNLSFGLPSLVPAIPVFLELQEVLGKEWIRVFDDELSPEVLEAHYRELQKNGGYKGKPALGTFDPRVIADATVNFYRSLIEK